MTTVLYADVLFIINFSMDFLSVYITAKLLSLRQSALRFSAAAVLGAAAATAMTACGVASLAEALLTVVLSLTMSAAAFGFGGVRAFFLRAFVMWGAGALLGGAVSALCALGEGISDRQSISPHGSRYSVILASGAVLVCLFIRLIRPALSKKETTLTVGFGSKTVTVTALVDSGNLASDPISGSPVIFLSAAEAVGLIGERDTAALLEHDRLRLSEEMTRRLRLVPVCGEGGDRLYFAFRPDSVTVGKKGAHRDALVAVSDKDGKYYAGHPALAPSGIL